MPRRCRCSWRKEKTRGGIAEEWREGKSKRVVFTLRCATQFHQSQGTRWEGTQGIFRALVHRHSISIFHCQSMNDLPAVSYSIPPLSISLTIGL